MRLCLVVIKRSFIHLLREFVVFCNKEDVKCSVILDYQSQVIDEIVKSLPLFRISLLTSFSLEAQNIRIDSYLDPAKPVLQLPYEESKEVNSKGVRLNVVIDQMKDKRFPKYVLRG